MSYRKLYTEKNILKIVPFVVVCAMVAFVYFFPQDDLRTLLIFVALLIAFFIYKFDMRILILVSLALLVLSGILIARNLEGITSRIALIGFWLLVSGVLGIVIDAFRNDFRAKIRNKPL